MHDPVGHALSKTYIPESAADGHISVCIRSVVIQIERAHAGIVIVIPIAEAKRRQVNIIKYYPLILLLLSMLPASGQLHPL